MFNVFVNRKKMGGRSRRSRRADYSESERIHLVYLIDQNATHRYREIESPPSSIYYSVYAEYRRFICLLSIDWLTMERAHTHVHTGFGRNGACSQCSFVSFCVSFSLSWSHDVDGEWWCDEEIKIENETDKWYGEQLRYPKWYASTLFWSSFFSALLVNLSLLFHIIL